MRYKIMRTATLKLGEKTIIPDKDGYFEEEPSDAISALLKAKYVEEAPAFAANTTTTKGANDGATTNA